MKLRQLFEDRQPSVGIIFGRFNPPHQGHKAAWEMAAQNDHWFVGTNQSTQGPKDPLPYDVKVKAMLAVMPEVKGHIVPETSWLTLASKVYKKYGDIILNVYTDEDWVTKALVQYNGKEGAHGFYNFSSIQQQPTPRLSSATALRAAVSAGDRDAFSQAAGVDADTPVAGHSFFDVVAHYLAPHAEKEKAKAAKKKVKEPEVAEARANTNAVRAGLSKREKRADPTMDAKKKSEQDAAWERLQAHMNKPENMAVLKRLSTKEDNSKAMDQTAKRLTDPNDGKVAKLRAAGDKRREDQLKGRDMAKRDRTSKDDWGNFKDNLSELSNELLGRYKKAAAADARKADAEGDFERGNKRFKGINRATMKQFANDAKKHGDVDEMHQGQHRTITHHIQQSQTPTKGVNTDAKKSAKRHLQREEAAGVGTITKQNTTVDVNKNTPKKNLKAFRLV